MDNKKKVKAAALTTVAAASVVTGALFDSPAELLPEIEPDAIVQELSQDDTGTAQEKKYSVYSRMRQWVLGLPAGVRLLVAIPLWLLGWLLMTGAGALVGGLAGPVERLISWICLLAVLVIVFSLSVKSAFPGAKFRQIVTPRRVLLLTVVSLVLGAADLAMPMVWSGYNPDTQFFWRISSACLLAAMCWWTLRWGQKKGLDRPALPPMTQEEIRDRARELADTVCPPRF